MLVPAPVGGAPPPSDLPAPVAMPAAPCVLPGAGTTKPARGRVATRPKRPGFRMVASGLAPPAAGLAGISGKGAMHARSCAGPFFHALLRQPAPPLTGRKRARAGLAAVPFPRAAQTALRQERAARALVALLPRASAAYILDASAEDVAAESDAAVAERLVDALKVCRRPHCAYERTMGRQRHPARQQLAG